MVLFPLETLILKMDPRVRRMWESERWGRWKLDNFLFRLLVFPASLSRATRDSLPKGPFWAIGCEVCSPHYPELFFSISRLAYLMFCLDLWFGAHLPDFSNYLANSSAGELDLSYPLCSPALPNIETGFLFT